jgi:NADH:ubiquinone oxidoreductase subunit E
MLAPVPGRGPESRRALFEGPYRERLDKIISRYPTPQGALLPALGLAQEIRGHLGADSMAQVAEALGLSPTYVRGVATFYTMYNKQPVGDYLVQVCTNVSCNLCGGDDVMAAFLEATAAEAGEITPDGLFTFIEAECLGACGFPTAVQVNERYFENVDRAMCRRSWSGSGRSVPPQAAAPAGRAAGARDRPGRRRTAPWRCRRIPGKPGETVAPEANPYAGGDGTPPAAARPPAADEPATGGQG